MGRLTAQPWRVEALWSILLAALICGPLLFSTGFWLAGDMVFVPRQPWKPEWLGLDGTLPRAVPGDAVVSVLTMLLPGWVVQRLLLLGGYIAGGLGIARLVRALPRGSGADGLPLSARLAAITFFVWNPWVHERLMIGQWAILVGCLLLPWVAVAALGLDRETPVSAPGRLSRVRPWAALYVALLVCAIASPAPGLFAVVVAWAFGARRSWRRWLALGGVSVLANLCWVAPALLSLSAVAPDGPGFDDFAPRAESGAGVLASLVSLGGIWKTSIVAPERTASAAVLVSVVLSGLAAAGLIRWARRCPTPILRLSLPALLALSYAWVASTDGGARSISALAESVSPLAMLRDSHRVLALLAPALAVGLAETVGWLRSAVAPGREALRAVVVALVVAPVLLLPSLAWGGGGELRPVHYPDEWQRVAHILESEPQQGNVVVLPWTGSYRGFDWAHRRAVLDPAPRYFAGSVLIDDRVLLGSTRVIESEDPRRAEIAQVLQSPDARARETGLAALGVQWVLVERGLEGADALPTGEVRHRGPGLELIALGNVGPTAAHWQLPEANRVMILASHVLWIGCLLLSLVLLVGKRSCESH